MPMDAYPRLSARLPAMASDATTLEWTGAAGRPLLQQSTAFVRACADQFACWTGSTLRQKRILDFGCGYGRFLRLFAFYTDSILGVDAWESSLRFCRDAGLADLVHRSEPVPTALPVIGRFDFIFSFSVFTHLSDIAALACLGALRQVISPAGLLAITVRPVEFWSMDGRNDDTADPAERQHLIADHRRHGFAFRPHPALCDQGEVTHYGDASLTTRWLQSKLADWQVVAIDRSCTDPCQRYVFLRPV
jgi:SAM-dependent methyltransferase